MSNSITIEHHLGVERYLRHPAPTRRDVAALLFRRGRVVLGTFVLVVGAAVIIGFFTPRYESEMKIVVRHQRMDPVVSSSSDAQAQVSSDAVSEEDLNTEVELLNSEDLLRKVVLRTGLALGAKPANAVPSEVQIERAVRQLGKQLTIEPLHKSNVISVRYEARQPEKGVEVLQALSAAYMEKHLEVHRSTGEFKFFDQQMKQYQQRLDEAQERLAGFTDKYGVVSAEQERDSALRQASEFDTEKSQAQTGIHETMGRIRELQAKLGSMQPRMTTVVHTAENPQLLEQLKSTLLNLELKRRELLSKYDPAYRPVVEVEKQIADTKEAISREESSPLRDETSDQDPNYLWVREELTKAEADLSSFRAREAAAAKAAEQYLEAAQELNRKRVEQQDLMRAAKTQEDNYLLYVRKREEARISDALDQRGILNVAMAEQPAAAALPSRSPLNAMLLVLLAAGSASLSAAFVVDLLDPSFRTPDEVVRYLGVRVLAALPKGGE